jgi:hypothetical protein
MEHKLEQTLDRIGAKDLGRYALMTHDTALFQGMQAAMNYGDFLMKAVLFDHYTQDKGISNQDALAKITEEFGHSDRLPGRVRGTLESDGLLWFYNFKLRITKSAVSTLRENPLHALLAAAIPAPPLVGTVGTPLNSNVLSMLFGGNLHWSLGMGMGLHSHGLLPSVKGVEALLGG